MVSQAELQPVVTGATEVAPPVTETVAVCPLCQSCQLQPWFATRDYLHRLPGEFGLVSCVACQFLILSPRPLPSAIGFYYPSANYYSYQAEMVPNAALESRPLLRWLRDGIRDSVLAQRAYPIERLPLLFRLLQPLIVRVLGKRALYSTNDFPRYVPGGRALELGCGSGAYLACLKKHGWQVVGVELSQQAAQVAHAQFGIQVRTEALHHDSFAPNSFDYIRLSDVIEHLPDPVATLQLLKGFLKPGGVLFLQTPNASSFGFRCWRDLWFGCDSPRHLYLFSAETLRRTVAQAGLQVSRLKTLPIMPGAYSTEFTYAFEKAQPGASRAPRFQYQAGERQQAYGLVAKAYWHWLKAPLSGEVLQCWATKE